MRTYTLREVRSLLGLSPAVLRGLVAAGFVTPARGPRNAYRFTFRDVVLLRTAGALQAAAVPARKIVRALARLRAELPAELPLSGLRIAAVGSEVVVSEGGRRRHVDSGQWLIDFEVRERGGEVAVLGGPAADAAAWFERGAALEARDRRGAQAAYRRAIALAPQWVDPVLNLGCLLGEGDADAAIALYEEALARAPRAALLHFNLGIALEDAGRGDAALAAYERALALDAALADAHFNAARLHEIAGRSRQAIRHYAAYRRLQRS